MTLRLIIGLGLATLPVAVVACWAIDARLLALLGIVWGWMLLMAFEFFVPAWLKARPFIYMVSHMLIMPAIDLLVTGFEWLPHGAAPAGLALLLAFSFTNGCVLEIGRKLWAPENEREGVESYSALMGPGAGRDCCGSAASRSRCLYWYASASRRARRRDRSDRGGRGGLHRQGGAAISRRSDARAASRGRSRSGAVGVRLLRCGRLCALRKDADVHDR